MGIKMSLKTFPSGMWSSYVKYDEAEVHRLEGILKT